MASGLSIETKNRLVPCMVFGLHRTGTNYMEMLLCGNFLAKLANHEDYCWKHSHIVPREVPTEIPKLVVFKHPLTWIESVSFRESWDMEIPWELADRRERKIGNLRFSLEELCRLYTVFFYSWVDSIFAARVSVLRYEDFLLAADIRSGLSRLAGRHGFSWKAIKIHIPQAGTVQLSEVYQASDSQYYLKRVPKHLTKHQVDRVYDLIPDEVWDRLGYSKEKKGSNAGDTVQSEAQGQVLGYR